MQKLFLSGSLIVIFLFFIGCGDSGDEVNPDTTTQNELGAVSITVKDAPDESNYQKELTELSIRLDNVFYLEDAARATIRSQGSIIEFSTDADLQIGEGPDDPLIAFLWYSSAFDRDEPFMRIKKMGDSFQYQFDDEVVFDDKLYVFIIGNTYQGNIGNISATVKIDGLVENQFAIESELNLLTNDLIVQSYGASPRSTIDDNIYRTTYWVDIESSFADPTLIPALVWWPDNEHPIGCVFPYDKRSGFYNDGPAVSISSNYDLNLVEDAKYIFFVIDTRIIE